MKLLFIDTVNVKEIKKYMVSGLFEGVTTNPTLFYKAGLNPEKGVDEILSCKPYLLFIQIAGNTFSDLKNHFEQIHDKYKSDSFGVKISLNQSGLEFIKYLKSNYSNQIILGTAVYSAEQGILGALAGCDYVAPYVNRMSNENIDPLYVIASIRKFIDSQQLPTSIMGASFKNTQQVIDSLNAGAHTVTISEDILDKMFNNKLAESAIREFDYHNSESLNY